MLKPHRTLLVIDDSPDEDTYEHQLRQDTTFSYTVLTERYGTQIPAVCRSHPINGILLELVPPHSHSLDFLSQLKEQMGENCPPIVVIDSGDAEIAVRALKTGAVDYLVKERMTPDDLRLAVRSAIENAELRQELQSCQDRFQTSVENMLDCFGIFSSICNESGQIIDFRIDYLNAAACENNRMPKAMQIGKGLCELLPAHRETGLFEEYCRVVETGTPLIKESLIYDDNYNGQRLTRAFDIHAARLDDGVVVSWRDVTERKQAEIDRLLMLQQLQQSEERLRIAQTAANAGLWDWDIAADRLYWSAEYYTLYGLDPNFSSSYTHWLDSLLEADREQVHQITQELLTNRQTDVNLEFRIRHPVLGIRWLNAIGQVFYNPSGQAVRITGITLDISDRKQMEAQRNQAEAAIGQLNHDLANRVSELQTLLEVIPIGIAIASDPACTQMQSNAYIRQLLGISMGVNISKSVPAQEQLPYQVFQNAQEMPAEDLPMQAAARLGVEVRDTELEILLPDGTTRGLLAYAAPLRDDEGKIRGAIGAFLDVTERKQAEAALQAANSRAITIAEAMPQMVWTADARGAVNYFNQRWYEYSGLSEAESMGLAYANTIHPDDRDRILEQWNQSVARGELFEVEYRIRRWDGVYHWFISRGVPTGDSQGQITGWIGTITDIDDHKRLEARLLDEIANHQRTEQELRVANQQITSILESMTDAFIAVDQDWNITYINQMTAHLNQVSPEEVIGKSHWEVWAATVGTICEENYCRAIAEQIPVHFEYFYEAQQRWYEIHAYPSPDGLGIYLRDIHERKHSEAKLRESQVQLQQQLAEIEAIYQSAPIGLGILDSDLRFMRINQRLAQINGLPVEAHIGRTVRELLPNVANTAEQFLRPILETGEPLLNVEIQGETPAQPGVQHTWLEQFLPLKNGNQVIGISIVCEEITDRKQAEASVRESEERLRLALRAANQGLYDLNVQTGEAIVSPEYAQMLGYDPDEFQETNAMWRDRLHPDDLAGVYQVYEDYIAGRRDEYRVEFRQRTKSGDWKWILSLGKIVSWDSNGKPLRMLGTHTDITDHKEAEAQREQLLHREQSAREAAEQANRLKDEFLAVLSHELRTPLNPILGWVSLLQSRQFSAAQIQQALATIERNARLQLQLIDDLLDIARIIRGKLVLNQEPVSLSDVIAAAAETVRLSMEAQSIHLEIEQVCDVQPVSGDAGRLQQVIGNLLSNAVKFTPQNGRVIVRLEQVGNQAQIQVIDTGKGIKPEFLPHIFELFRQQDSSTTREYGGLGLGLAISRQVIEMHGGRITADSPGEGLGATFSVCLPLMPITQPLLPSPVVKATIDLQGVRVLAVDDEADSLELIKFLLEQEGAIVTTASSGQQVLQALAQSQFDVLVSDIGMPEMDGYSLVRQIRMLPPEQGGDICAIALSAYAAESDRQQAFAAGYQLHLPKPIAPDRLIAAIHSFK